MPNEIHLDLSSLSPPECGKTGIPFYPIDGEVSLKRILAGDTLVFLCRQGGKVHVSKRDVDGEPTIWYECKGECGLDGIGVETIDDYLASLNFDE